MVGVGALHPLPCQSTAISFWPSASKSPIPTPSEPGPVAAVPMTGSATPGPVSTTSPGAAL